MPSLLRDVEEYCMEGERPTIIMSLDTDLNTKEKNQINLDVLYQENINHYIKRRKEFKKNLRKSYTVVWESCNKQLQTSIGTNIYYKTKIKDNPIGILEFIKILMQKLERSKYPIAWITEDFKYIVNISQK